MDFFVERILDHPDLIIDAYHDKHGKLFYTGNSNSYQPKTARGSTPDSCFLKFDIPLWEQKKIAAFMKNHEALHSSSR